MTKKLLTGAALLLSGVALSACAPVETKTSLVTPSKGATMTAGPGDIVLSFQARKALPNAFGKADLFGRTTNAGGTTVRYVGSQGQQALFERTDVVIDSNATTMTESPMVLPSTTNTSVYGTIGGMPVSGTATSTSYKYIPPQGSSEYAAAQRPVQINLSPGESVKIQGRTLTIIRVSPASVEYQID